MAQHGESLAWPYSSLTALAWGVLPALGFVWAGLLVYWTASARSGEAFNGFQVLQSLSTSTSVLLLATVLLLAYLWQPAIGEESVVREDFFRIAHLFAVSIPLTLSLLAATVSVRPPRAGLVRI